MTPERRQWLVGGGVVAVLGVAAWLQMRPAATTAPAAVTARARAQASAGPAAAGPMTAVKLPALEQGRDEPTDTSRNPFRFQPKVAPAPPRPVEPPQPAVGAGPSAPAAPTGPPPPPPIPLKFIGLVEKADGTKVAVLTDGRVTLYGREGDIIDGRYRIVKIGVESIELTHADGRGRQTVRLTGQ